MRSSSIVLIIILGITLQLLNDGTANSSVSGKIPIEVMIIESPGCSKCSAMERVLGQIDTDVPLNITHYYYYTDEGKRVIKARNIKSVPAVILGPRVINYRDYKGDNAKMEQLIRDAIIGNNITENMSISLLRNQNVNLDTDIDSQAVNLHEFSLYTILVVLVAGVIAGFNPCVLGIMIFLASSVFSSMSRRRELVGMVVFFSLGIFVMYFILGLGMQRLLHMGIVNEGSRNLLTAILLIAGLSQILDAIRLNDGKSSVFRTDWALKYFRAGVDKRRLSSYFLIGALFSLVKIPCLCGIYLAILDLLSTQSYLVGVTYLFSFNLGVVLPVIALGCLLTIGISPVKVDAFRKDHRVCMRLIMGLTLVALAPLIYWQWI